MKNTPLELSRDCIRDTYLYKREAGKRMNGFALACYRINMGILRSGQLAPYIETKMRKNRILDLQRIKREAPDLVIVIRDGMVEEVRSTNPYTQIYIADYDCNDAGDTSTTEEAEERAMMLDMHIVYG